MYRTARQGPLSFLSVITASSGTMLPDGRSRLQPADVADLGAVRRVGLRGDAPGAAEEIEIVDVGRAEIGAERRKDVLDRHAQLLGALAIDVGIEPRRVGAEGREDALKAGRLVCRRDQTHAHVFERPPVGAVAILDDHLVAAAGADAAHGRRRHDEDGAGGDGSERALQFGGDLQRGFAFAALLQWHKHRRGVRRRGEGGAVEAGESDGAQSAGIFQRDRLRLPQDLVGALERCSRRHLDDPDRDSPGPARG